ncbi:MAG: TolC family protein [Pirellulaceae bacterium]
MRSHRFLPCFALFATFVGLAGCAVSPVALTEAEIAERATDQLSRVTLDQEPVSGAIDLYEAMARALKYNLDHRVEAMDAALRIRELDLSHFNLLPNLVASSGYTMRDNVNASSSFNVLTSTQNFGASTSQEKKISSADVAFSWNVLDFGLSYIRARQAGDKLLISKEMRRKVMHRVIEDVRTAYWRSVTGEFLLTKLRGLENRVRSAQESSQLIAAERSTSPITAVTYERELVEIKRAIHELERDLVVAKTQLAALINLRPGTRFNVALGARSQTRLALNQNAASMVWTAMLNRAELRDVWYKKRINQHELDAAFLELLPGMQMFAGTNFDSNEFLYNHNWLNWGAKASWNLLRVAQYPAKREVINAQQSLLDERGLAVTMAVMTQVHVSRVRFYHFQKELKTATEYLEVQTRLLRLMREEAGAGRISEHTIIREEMNTLVAEVKRDIAHASLQNAFANVFASMGLDPYAMEIDLDQSVNTLAKALRGLWFERGDYNAGNRVSSR